MGTVEKEETFDAQQQQSSEWTRQPASYWIVCPTCRGEGRLKRRSSRKSRHQQQHNKRARSSTTEENGGEPITVRWDPCQVCNSTGLISAPQPGPVLHSAEFAQLLPTVAIIGGGIAGLALAAACRHRGIPHVVFERDVDFFQRSQGFGLTMQQASKALKSFGILQLKDGITSTKHVVHTSDGTVVGEWGMRHWDQERNQQQLPSADDSTMMKPKKEARRQNVHIARQALRYQLMQAATAHECADMDAGLEKTIHWNHRLVKYQQMENNQVQLTFQTGDGNLAHHVADLVVGADGFRSQVRAQLIGNEQTPLRFLECFVMLGICPLSLLDDETRTSHLLDGYNTVFQTADGTTRMYMMPYSKTEYMWQLSFPMPDETAAKALIGPQAQLQEALRRCKLWHKPIPEILYVTPPDLITGYPVYDRPLLTKDVLLADGNSTLGSSWTSRCVTLMGDAAHPMSPFKGQGANQALLDALSLARALYRAATTAAKGDPDAADKSSVVQAALQDYETDMMERSAVKVQASAEAAQFLHTDVAIRQGNCTRGAANRQVDVSAESSSSMPSPLVVE